jgi:hypothetical protein
MTTGKDPDIVEGGTRPWEDVWATYIDATGVRKTRIWGIARQASTTRTTSN